MKKSSQWIIVSSVVGAALLYLSSPGPARAQTYAIRPTCNPADSCRANTANFGYNDTNWRQWPLQARPEEKDSKTIGGTVIPTPPPIPEPQLPHAESVPSKPPVSGDSLLPFQGLSPGPATPPGTPRSDGGTSPNPNARPAGQNPQAATPPGLPNIDFGPTQPDATPKPNGGGIEPITPLSPPKESVLPGATIPDLSAPAPVTPSAQPPKTQDKSAPAPISPDPAPFPPTGPDLPAPAKPIKGISLLPRRNDAVALRTAEASRDLPMQANWNAALEPEALSGNLLRTASYEQRAAETGNPFRCGMGGYCPVQLREKDRWVAGNAEYQTSYQGQVYHFSSEAARKQFETTPERYAPAQGGNDVVMTAEENRTVPGDVNHSAVWHGRLYLFSNSATLAAFQAEPARYARLASQRPSESAALRPRTRIRLANG